ncbi:MAG: hypothetical protein CMJ27_02665 [Phycisphaerae bacterium]|nr:hypothetical protein [Phycisphaerae bacterium]
MKPTPIDLGSIRRLGILMPNWLGDAVMAEPTIRAIADTAPQLEITSFGKPGTLAMLAGHSAITDAIPLRDGGLLGPFAAAREVRRHDLDALLLLRGSFRAGLLGRISGIRPILGYARDGRGPLLSHPVPVDRGDGPRPTVDDYAMLAATAFGITIEDRLPRLVTTADERAAADSLLDGIEGPSVAFVVGGSKLLKRWPTERFVELARRLPSSIENVLLLGGPDEAELLATIARDASGTEGPAVVDLAARGLGLDSLRGVIERCLIMVTNDTGPRHLAVALGVPTVAIFGPTDHRWTTLPGARERVLVAQPFLPEELVADDHPSACAVDRIPVSDVLHAVQEAIDEPALGNEVSSSP